MGMMDPPQEYWNSISDGKGEATLLKAAHEMRKQSRG